MSSSGVFQGAFRGPASAFGSDGATSPPTLFAGATAPTSPGDPGDVVVTVGAVSGPGDEPTVTITFLGVTTAFNFDTATSATSNGGFVTQDVVAATNGTVDLLATRFRFDFGGESSFYSTMYEYIELDALNADTFLNGYTVVGADNVSMPAGGSATFDTAVYGLFAAASGTDGGFYFGRGDVLVNFAAGSVTGLIPDVDFLDTDFETVSETTPGLLDFGLDIDALVSGDEFSGAMSSTGGLVSMTGDVEGDFFGPTNGAPVEIGGAYFLIGPDGGAVGALQGIAE